MSLRGALDTKCQGGRSNIKFSFMKKPRLKLETLTFKTFLRGFLVVVFFILMLVGIVIHERPFKLHLHEGDIALKSVYAPHDFFYIGPVDETKTEQQRQKARKSVYEIYSLNPQPLSDGLVILDKFFQQLPLLKTEFAKIAQDKVKEQLNTALQEELDISLSENSIKAFLKIEDTNKLFIETKKLLHSIYSVGILSKMDKTRLQDAGEKYFVILDKAIGTERTVEIEKTPSEDQVVLNIYANAKRSLSNKKTAPAVSELSQNLVKSNLYFETELTQSRRKDAAQKTPLQYQQVEVKKGELIISKGQRVSPGHIAQLITIERLGSRRDRFNFFIGLILLILLLLFIVTTYLILYEPKIFHDTISIVLIGILAIIIIYIARAIMISPMPSYLIPLASISMFLAILLNHRLAIFMTVVLSIAVGVNIENSLNVVIMFLFGGLVGIFSVRNIRKRWHIIRSGILVGATNCVSIITTGLLNGLNFDSFRISGAWGFVNGIVCSFIVMGLLPILEDLFKITTNITLLELSDMNHPLLKELILKASGTYHHSLMVGNLAESAADIIGANSLLARVGAYYHDVGKIHKAEYFSENYPDVKSLHDKLTPSMSHLVITNHTKDGLELGKRYKLSKAILDFIEQHHGTSLVYYFFQKALERVEDETILKEEGFRYAGPKPQTKEAAIVLLADSVEAASRTLTNPTPSRVADLVHRIINNKFIDGQLDECELTLNDLNKIAESFIRILMGILHTRVEYPPEKNSNENQHN